MLAQRLLDCAGLSIVPVGRALGSWLSADYSRNSAQCPRRVLTHFRSKAHYDPFVVEATCLDPDAVTDRSNLPNEISEDNPGGAFGMVTQSVFDKVRDKAPQVANYPMPTFRLCSTVRRRSGRVLSPSWRPRTA
jgi:hypothetical protein